MAFKVEWLTEEKRALHLYFDNEGISSWSEYRKTVDEAWAMAQTVDHEIIAIFATYDTPMPMGSPMTPLQRTFKTMPSNVRFGVTIVERMFEKMVVDMVAKLGFAEISRTVSSWNALNRLLKSENLPIIPDEDIPPRLH